MHIEKKYFTEEQAQWKRITKEVEDAWNNLTDEEKAAEHEKRKRDIHSIWEKHKKRMREHPRFLNDDKMERFRRIADDALSLAEKCNLNITIDLNDKLYGVIQFMGDFMLLMDVASAYYKVLFSNLILSASDTEIASKDGTVIIKFTYELFDEL